MSTLDDFLWQLCQRLPRILGVILTDKDGVTVAKCTLSVDDMILRTDAELSETKLERSYFAQVSNDMEKAVKLDLGSSTSMTCFYSNLCLVHVNFHPILVTFVGSSDINVGSIHSILPVLKTQLEFVRSVHKDDA